MLPTDERQWLTALAGDLVAIGCEPSKTALAIAIAALLAERYRYGRTLTIATELADITGRHKSDIARAIKYLESLSIISSRPTTKGPRGKPIKLSSRITDIIDNFEKAPKFDNS